MSLKQVLDLIIANAIRHLPVMVSESLGGVISLRNVVGNWPDGISDEMLDGDAATEPRLDPFSKSQGHAA